MAMGCQDSSFIEPSISKQCIHQVMNADYAMSSRLVEYYIDKQSYHAFDLLNHVLSTKINPRDPSLDTYPLRKQVQRLASMYHYGTHGAPLNGDAAEHYYQLAIQLGDVESMRLIAELYTDSRKDLEADWLGRYQVAQSIKVQ